MAEEGATRFWMGSREQPTFFFVGVTTGQSSMARIFPHWMRELGRPDVVLEGIDLKLHDDRTAYRRVVTQVKHDPNVVGALVTTHKIDLFAAAGDLFDDLDPYARICQEVSCLAKREGRLEGQARDPISVQATLDTVLGPSYFAMKSEAGGDVLCFGAGGAATAISLQFINRPNGDDRPRRFVVVDRLQDRLDKLRHMVEGLETDIAFDYIRNDDPQCNDALMDGMGRGALVINATGMGKDLPGSPITDAGSFPVDAVAWELNYRGALRFLYQAAAQRESRGVVVEDGWRYFLHGWTQVIAEVLGQEIGEEQLERLSAIAREVAGPPPARR